MSSNGQPGFQVASHRQYDSVSSCIAPQLKPQSGNVFFKAALFKKRHDHKWHLGVIATEKQIHKF